jgi:hypothetical protein
MIDIKRLIWDTTNREHIARHGVTPDEVEEVCHGEYVVLDGHHGRLLVIGLTSKGRALTTVLDPEPEEGVYYPVTARSADKKERRYYQAEKGGDDTHDQAA